MNSLYLFFFLFDLVSLLKFFLCYLQTSLTAAGCYLCPAPRSKGTKALVCFSVDHPLPQRTEFLNVRSCVGQHQISNDIEQIIAGSKSCLDRLVPDASKVHFLDITSESVFDEARRLDMLSESTYENILQLQSEEVKHFRSKKKASEFESKHKVKSISMYSEPLHPGQICSLMNRFFVQWKIPEEADCEHGLGRESWRRHFRSCVVGDDIVAQVRHMGESDWLYLADLVKSPTSLPQQQKLPLDSGDGTSLCLDCARNSAQRALRILKSIPAAARRGLPVLVNSQGLLLSIPVTKIFPFLQLRQSSLSFEIKVLVLNSFEFCLLLEFSEYSNFP